MCISCALVLITGAHEQSLADQLTLVSHTQCGQQFPMQCFRMLMLVLQMECPVLVQHHLQAGHAWVQGLLMSAGSCSMI